MRRRGSKRYGGNTLTRLYKKVTGKQAYGTRPLEDYRSAVSEAQKSGDSKDIELAKKRYAIAYNTIIPKKNREHFPEPKDYDEDEDEDDVERFTELRPYYNDAEHPEPSSYSSGIFNSTKEDRSRMISPPTGGKTRRKRKHKRRRTSKKK
jgi:hypothetical protein